MKIERPIAAWSMWVALLLPVVSWGLLFFLFPPSRQNFPLADDWFCARGFEDFVAGRGAHYFHKAAMPQLGQWLWAWPFSRLGLPLHTALRLATLAASLLGLWGFADLLRGRGISPGVTALATAALAANPLFFLLQGTFMTDVPALAFALFALAWYERALRGQSAAVVPALVGALFAVSTRQNMVAAPVAAAVALWRERRVRTDPIRWISVLVPIGVGIAAHAWLQTQKDAAKTPVVPQPPALMLLLPFLALHLGGLSSLPFAALAPRSVPGRVYILALLGMLLGAGYWYYYGNALTFGGRFPYVGGVLSLWGAFIGNLSPGALPLVMTGPVRTILTLIGCTGGALLIGCLASSRPRLGGSNVLMVFTLLQLPLLAVAPLLTDRYFLAVFPGLFGWLAAVIMAKRLRWLAGWAMVLTLQALSVALMHDCFAWNAARWELGRELIAKKINPWDIEGGFEWDGWFAPLNERASAEGGWTDKRLALPFTQRYFPHIRGLYALSFSELPHSQAIAGREYYLWLVRGRQLFLVLRAEQASPDASGMTKAK